MCFKKRKNSVVYSGNCSIPDVKTSPDGVREVVLVSPDDYFVEHPISHEEFTLTQEISAGVPLKEINCSSLLDSTEEFSGDTEIETLDTLNVNNNNNPNE